MDNTRLRKLLLLATEDGIMPQELVHLADEESSIEEGRVLRANLLSMYTRRLNRTAGNRELHEATLNLVDFLRNYPSEELTMISIRPNTGGFHLFIADSESSKLLFWMRMFSTSN